MTDLRKAAEMALDYIEQALQLYDQQYQRHPSTEHDRQVIVDDLMALRQALAQPKQGPVAGKGKEFSEQLKLCARNVAFVSSGQVDMSSAAMQEMFALIDHVCVGLDSPPALAQPEQEPVAVWKLEEDGWNTIADPDWMETLPVGTLLYTAPPSIEAAVLAEREACAKVCNLIAKEIDDTNGTATYCAKAIRARGKK